MDPVYNTVTVNEQINFPLYNTTSSIVIERTMGLRRISTDYLTTLPFDTLQVTRPIISLTKLVAPICEISNLLTADNVTITTLLTTPALTLTGPFNGTSANFSGNLSCSQFSAGSTASFQGGVQSFNRLTMSGDTAAKRSIDNCYYNTINATNLTEIDAGRFYYLNATFYLGNNKNGGNFLFATRDTSGVSSLPLEVAPTGVNVYKNLTITAGNNIIQPFTDHGTSDSSRNFLKATFIRSKVDMTLGGSVPTFEIVDFNAIERGLLFVPNAAGGAFNPIVKVNDSVICGRRNQGDMATAFTLWTQTACGVRLESRSLTTANVTIKASTNEIIISENVINPITVNNKISMVGTTSGARRISNVSVLAFFDTQGVQGVTEIYPNSTTLQTQYVNYLPNMHHTFYNTNASSVMSSTFTITPDTVATTGVPLQIRSSVSTTRFEFNPDVSGVTFLTGTNSAGLNSQLQLRLRDSATTLRGVYEFSPTQVIQYVPTDTTAFTPTNSRHTGYLTTGTETTPAWGSNSSALQIAELIISQRGTYQISTAFKVKNNHAGNFLIDVIRTATCTSGSLFPSAIKMSETRMCSQNITINQEVLYNNSFTYQKTTATVDALPFAVAIIYNSGVYTSPSITVDWSIVKLC